DLALLWEPIRSGKRRQESEAANSDNSSISDFPSWSWAGWMCPVAYKEGLVGSILDNVSEWLQNHTWIQWWVRDGHGDLRPLWDRLAWVADTSEEARWRGYSSER